MTIQRNKFDALCNEGFFSGPVSDEEVQAAEAALGLRFPQEYLDMLKTYGAVVGAGFAIYGLPRPEQNAPLSGKT